jgi:hypothetical protein
MALIDAPDAGTGKGLFADVISIIATGRSGGFMTAPTEDEEWRKRITSTLARGQTIITIDNVEGTLDSPSLASALTSQVWQDRILGKSEMIAIPQRATWIVTGNNIQLGGDIPRRCYWIRLDAKVECPWKRSGWRHSDLRDWVAKHRGQLLAALLILARAHYGASLVPHYGGPVIGSFEPWCRATGGILLRANVEGFLGNLQEMYTTSDEERPQWEAFFGALATHYRGKDFIVADLLRGLDTSPTLRESLPYDLADIYHGSRHKVRQSLGKALSRHKAAQYGQWRLERAGDDTHGKVARWQVVTVPVANAPAA